MLVFKCDICKKEIEREEEHVMIGVRYALGDYTLCMACAEPVIAFLKEKKLTQDSTK